jgi:hypothetical protein
MICKLFATLQLHLEIQASPFRNLVCGIRRGLSKWYALDLHICNSALPVRSERSLFVA